VLVALESAAGVRVLPRFDALVRVLDHHDRGIDHRADRDRDASERHDVGVDALALHHDEGDQHAQRQRHDGHQRRAQVPQEHRADQRDDDEFLDQLVAQVRDGTVDQLAAVVGRDDLDARRQARLQLVELGPHRGDGFACVLA
jgi:hypothetical protein